MCLILFAWQPDDTHKLVVAANRDEYLHRDTLPANYWEDAPHVLAGKDLEANGTWLGVTRTGRFAAVTNFRKPDNTEYQRSRGLLTANFLKGSDTASGYLSLIEANADEYAGFNLIISDGDELWYLSNRDNTGKQKLTPGIYGLSNHLLDTPWPKVKRGKKKFSDIIQTQAIPHPHLLRMLNDKQEASKDELPNTGIGKIFERMLSPMFIKIPGYGTRASTVLSISSRGDVLFIEQNHPEEDYELKEFRFTTQ